MTDADSPTDRKNADQVDDADDADSAAEFSLDGDARQVAEDLFSFVDAAPSPFHAVAEVVRRLGDAGFSAVAPGETFNPGRHLIASGGVVIAWDDSEATSATTGFRIVGAHTDSPNLRIKPNPDHGSAGLSQLGVEVYGGVLLNSWLDRDLGLSGRVAVSDGPPVLIRVDRPLLRVPQLAIHLDREISDKGLKLNRQTHMSPIWATGDSGSGNFREFLADELAALGHSVDPDQILAWDLMTHDLTPSSFFGRDESFYAAPRIDNLCSVHSATRAMVEASASGSIPVIAFFDHEEVGSTSRSGAGSPALLTVLERSVLARGGDREDFHRALAGSHAVSADGAHATHPNYADRHEPQHQIALNGGPVLKVNANQRYATDAESAAPILVACEDAEVPVQRFVTRTDLGCGSTIGPLTAAVTGLPVVDFGAAQLSMHSAREMAGSADPLMLTKALTAYLAI